jgi:hypothetical protein
MQKNVAERVRIAMDAQCSPKVVAAPRWSEAQWRVPAGNGERVDHFLNRPISTTRDHAGRSRRRGDRLSRDSFAIPMSGRVAHLDLATRRAKPPRHPIGDVSAAASSAGGVGYDQKRKIAHCRSHIGSLHMISGGQWK